MEYAFGVLQVFDDVEIGHLEGVYSLWNWSKVYLVMAGLCKSIAP